MGWRYAYMEKNFDWPNFYQEIQNGIAAGYNTMYLGFYMSLHGCQGACTVSFLKMHQGSWNILSRGVNEMKISTCKTNENELVTMSKKWCQLLLLSQGVKINRVSLFDPYEPMILLADLFLSYFQLIVVVIHEPLLKFRSIAVLNTVYIYRQFHKFLRKHD